MSRYRVYTPGDDAPADAGDAMWSGVYPNAEPSQLPAGMLADGANLRCRTGRPTTRRGLWKPAWMNQLQGPENARQVIPWRDIHGQPREFSDPNGIRFLMLAADENIWALKPYNTPLKLALPTGIKILSEVAFIQAFNMLFVARGEKMSPLVMDNLNDGFKDLIDRWDPTKAYEKDDVVAYGPFVTGTTEVIDTTLRVTTPEPHGLITGSDVQLINTEGGKQDGRYTVTVIDESVFDVHPSDLSTVGRTLEWTTNWDYWRSADFNQAGDKPGLPGETNGIWERDYLVMPNFTDGIFINNRLLGMTSWIPGAEFKTGGYGSKRDFIAASYVLDYQRFAPNNEFRINQGSSDELNAILKIGNSSVIAFKGSSVGLIANVTGDLSSTSLEFIIRNYGVVGPRAATEVGKDVCFVSPRRGVISLRQTDQGQIQGTENALSFPIQPWIEQIDWPHAESIRLAYWNDALYLAAPVGGSECATANWVKNLPYSDFLDLRVVSWTEAGMTFRWTPPSDHSEVLLCNGSSFSGTSDVTWDGKSKFGIQRNHPTFGPEASGGSLQRMIKDANTAVLVYDFQLGAWQPIDRGTDLCVREWFITTLDGIERLCCVTFDGYLNLYDECTAGDQVFDPSAPNLLSVTPIASFAVTRGYSGGNAGFKTGSFARLVIATQAPEYSLSTTTEGIVERSDLVTNRTRSPVIYERPAGAPRWQPDNANKDFYTPYRQDYSVYLAAARNPLLLSGGGRIELGSTGKFLDLYPMRSQFDLDKGIAIDLKQEANHPLRMSRPRGRWHQAIVSNTTGSIELRALALELAETSRQPGLKV
jgi:hypothetical protein